MTKTTSGSAADKPLGRPTSRVLDEFPLKDEAPVAPRDERPVVEFHRRGTKDDYVVFPYGHLVWVNYAASYGIILHFSSHTVYVKGTSLEPVYEGLREQTLRKVHEGEGKPTSNKATFVERIYITQHAKGDSMFKMVGPQELEEADS